MPRHKPTGPTTLTITEEAMRLALTGLERIEAEIQSHIADVRATLDAPMKRTYTKREGGRELTEAQIAAMRQNIAKGRAKQHANWEAGKSGNKSVVVPPKQSSSPPMEFWPNGEPKYLTNPDGSVRLTRLGKPWKRIRQGQATAAAIKSHVARGLKPSSDLKRAQRMAKQAGLAKTHPPIDPRHVNSRAN